MKTPAAEPSVVLQNCAVLQEVAFDIIGYDNLEIYSSDQKLSWRLKPNQHACTRIDHGPAHNNSHGTRGGEFQIEKPAVMIRILWPGES